jgi:hypothetical protein
MTDSRVARRDEEAWWGLSPRGLVVAVVGVCLAVVGLSRHGGLGALGLGAGMILLAVPVGEEDLGERVFRVLSRRGARRWVEELGEGEYTRGRSILFTGYPVLSGEDPLRLAETLERVARRGGGLVSVHLWGESGVRHLAVVGDDPGPAPVSVWGSLPRGPFREYSTHLRSLEGVLQVGRVRTGIEGPWALAPLVPTTVGTRVVVFARVAGEGAGRRRSSRRAHRADADGASLHERGFRTSARRRSLRERVGLREEQVARGRAWVEWGVYLLVSGATLEEVATLRAHIARRAQSGGLNLAWGRYRQGEFLRGLVHPERAR